MNRALNPSLRGSCSSCRARASPMKPSTAIAAPIATAACSRTRKEGSVVLYTSLAPTESGRSARRSREDRREGRDFPRSARRLCSAVTEARARRFAVDVVETNGPEMESWRARSSSPISTRLPRRPAGERDSVAPPVDCGSGEFLRGGLQHREGESRRDPEKLYRLHWIRSGEGASASKRPTRNGWRRW